MGDSKMSAQPNVQYVNQQPPPAYSPHPQPPPPGMPMGGGITTTLIVAAPAGPDPMITTCPSCNHQILTRTDRKPSSKTHIIACCLLFFICWPCVFVPYCTDSCNNIDHYCPNCNAYIGGYRY